MERQHLDTFDTTGASRSVEFFWTSGKIANVTLQSNDNVCNKLYESSLRLTLITLDVQ